MAIGISSKAESSLSLQKELKQIPATRACNRARFRALTPSPSDCSRQGHSMVCRHWLEEPAQGPITKWERGKYSRLDPCHLLTLHRSKTVSVWRHGWGWTPSTQMSTNENLIGFAIYAALPRGHQAATCSFCHQNHCVFPSWSILAHGEHRPAGSLS